MKVIKVDKTYFDDIVRIEIDNFSNDDLYSSNQLLDCINSSCYIFNLLIDDNKKLVGFIIATNNTDHIDLCQIAIDRSMQGKGYGLLLLKSLDQYRLPIFIEVNEDNKNAIKFYLKNDFKEISRRANYYQTKKCIVMERK